MVAEEWDWKANGSGTQQTVTASSNAKAAWKCSQSGQIFFFTCLSRTSLGTGCPDLVHSATKHIIQALVGGNRTKGQFGAAGLGEQLDLHFCMTSAMFRQLCSR